MKYECSICKYYDESHTCLHPLHIMNVNAWYLCKEFELSGDDIDAK